MAAHEAVQERCGRGLQASFCQALPVSAPKNNAAREYSTIDIEMLRQVLQYVVAAEQSDTGANYAGILSCRCALHSKVGTINSTIPQQWS